MSEGSREALRERLGELVRGRRAGTLAPAALGAGGPARDGGDVEVEAPGSARDGGDAATATPRKRRARVRRVEEPQLREGVEAFLSGGEWKDARGGTVYVHERLRSEIEKPRPHWGRLPVPPPGEPDLSALVAHGLERVLFLDLETCGLSSSPVFLAGTMHWNGEDFVLRQYFARHYGEAGRDERLARDAGLLVLRDERVEDGVGNLVRYLVGVAHRHRFGSEKMCSHSPRLLITEVKVQPCSRILHF